MIIAGALGGTLLEADGIALDLTSRSVRVNGKPVDLGRREVNLLELLLRKAGSVATLAVTVASKGTPPEVKATAPEIEVIVKGLIPAGARTGPSPFFLSRSAPISAPTATARRANKPVESAQKSFRRREWVMLRFRGLRTLQKFS